MSAFRAALSQLNALTPQVDANQIRAPYQAASAAAGQLGQGLQQSLLASGQAAQNQYAAAQQAAQQNAAQFGISAGAGAQPTLLPDTGAAAGLAAQTQAQAAAAPQAASAWQQLLERTAASRVADANLQRSSLLTSARAQLAGNLPGLIGQEKDRAIQKSAADANNAYLRDQMTLKGQQDFRDYLLGAAKVKQSARQDAVRNDLERDKLAQKTKTDAERTRIQREALALKKRTETAQAAGLKGVAAATKAFTSTSKPGTKKVAKGWDVTVREVDPDTGFEGATRTIHLPDKRKVPKGYKFISAETHYATVPTSGGSAGITRAMWDAQMRSLLAQNPGRAAEVKAFLGPRPKK